MTLALNVDHPLLAGEYGRATFDAVGPLLLIRWSEGGPDLLRALTTTIRAVDATPDDAEPEPQLCASEPAAVGRRVPKSFGQDAELVSASADDRGNRPASSQVQDDLLAGGTGAGLAALERASSADFRGHAPPKALHKRGPFAATRSDGPR